MKAIKPHILICGVLLTIAISVLSDPTTRQDSSITMAEITIQEEGKTSFDATVYFDDQRRVRLDIDFWGEAMTSEIYRDNTMYSICGDRCDLLGEVPSPIHLFAVPSNFEANGTLQNCEAFVEGDEAFSCDILRYEIGDDLVGFGYANSEEQIIAIEVKQKDDSLVRTTIFRSSQKVEDDMFGVPEFCTCKGSICFLLDGSESVSRADFASMKQTIIDALGSAGNQAVELQLSASQFATRSYPISGVTNDKDEFVKSLEEAVQEGGLTDIQSGLSECYNNFADSDLLGSPSIVIITDGNYTNHPSLNGDPRNYASQIREAGIDIQAGPIKSPRFLDEDLIDDIVTNNSTFDMDSVQDIYNKVIQSKCQRNLCEQFDCGRGYCVCGGCVCPPGSDGDECRSGSNVPEVRVPSSDGDDDRSQEEQSSRNVGAIVGGVLGAFAGAALIGLLAFAAVKHFGGAGAAAAGAGGGGGGQMTGDPNPLYEQQGVGGENPLHGGD